MPVPRAGPANDRDELQSFLVARISAFRPRRFDEIVERCLWRGCQFSESNQNYPADAGTDPVYNSPGNSVRTQMIICPGFFGGGTPLQNIGPCLSTCEFADRRLPARFRGLANPLIPSRQDSSRAQPNTSELQFYLVTMPWPGRLNSGSGFLPFADRMTKPLARIWSSAVTQECPGLQQCGPSHETVILIPSGRAR